MNGGASAGWRQLTIVHVSDMHFGGRHFFNPPAQGAPTEKRSLLYSIHKDLAEGLFAVKQGISAKCCYVRGG